MIFWGVCAPAHETYDGHIDITLDDVHHSIKKPMSTHRTLNFLHHAQLHHYQSKASTLRVREHLLFSTTTENPWSIILLNDTFVVGANHTAVHDKVHTLCSILSTREVHPNALSAIRRACAPALLP